MDYASDEQCASMEYIVDEPLRIPARSKRSNQQLTDLGNYFFLMQPLEWNNIHNSIYIKDLINIYFNNLWYLKEIVPLYLWVYMYLWVGHDIIIFIII